jgi:glycosyltransferase involved in cell wall biosynthesis
MAAGDAVGHVAIVMLAPFTSGAEHQTLALCRYLRKRCRVTLLTNTELARLLREDPFFRSYTAGLHVVDLGEAFPTQPARSPAGALKRAALYARLQLRALGALGQLRPDVVHLVLAPTFFMYLPLFRLLPFPTVMTLAGEMRYVRYFYTPAKRLPVRLATRLADGLVACSADELENLSVVEPAQAARAVVLDNFTDVQRWAPGEKDPHLVTFAARLHPEKGALLFLEAAAQLVETHPNARFQLFGRGEQEEAVSERVRALGLTARVERGFTTDLSPHFARSSVFVSCQLHENLGSSSLLEAMASGNAVVATDVGQTRQIVDDAVGIRVPVDAGAMADALRTLLDDQERMRALGAAARERVLEQYGPQPYVAALIGVYERAIASRKASQ